MPLLILADLELDLRQDPGESLNGDASITVIG
jgi:hypothetical protein